MSPLPEHSYLRRLFITALVVIILIVLWRAEDVFLLLFLAGLVAIVLRAASTPFRNHTRLSDKAAVVATAFLFVVFFTLLGWFFAPRLADQVEQLSEKLPEIITELQDLTQQVPFAGNLFGQLLPPNEQAPEQGGNGQAGMNDGGNTSQDGFAPDDPAGTALEVFSAVVSGGIYFLFVVFAALFLALTPQLYRGGLLQLVPQERTRRAEEVITAVVHVLRSWLLGQLIAMAAVGVLTTLGLWALGVPLALLLGFIAGILFVPLLGPFVAALPAVLIALVQDPLTALYVVLLYFAIQQLESYAITPLVQQRTVHLPPVLTIVAVLVMHVLFGITGALVATPFLAVILVLVKMLYVQDVLGKNIDLQNAATER